MAKRQQHDEGSQEQTPEQQQQVAASEEQPATEQQQAPEEASAQAAEQSERVQQVVDEEQEQGFRGQAVDPRPNSEYSLQSGPESPSAAEQNVTALRARADQAEEQLRESQQPNDG